MAELVLGNADARIGDAELQRLHAVIGLLAADIDEDVAPFGELDGVAHEIGQDLADTAGIADHRPGDARVHPDNQLQVLLLGA